MYKKLVSVLIVGLIVSVLLSLCSVISSTDVKEISFNLALIFICLLFIRSYINDILEIQRENQIEKDSDYDVRIELNEKGQRRE
jgi:hypothetical protein